MLILHVVYPHLQLLFHAMPKALVETTGLSWFYSSEDEKWRCWRHMLPIAERPNAMVFVASRCRRLKGFFEAGCNSREQNRHLPSELAMK